MKLVTELMAGLGSASNTVFVSSASS